MKKNIKYILGIVAFGLLHIPIVIAQVNKASKEIPGGNVLSSQYDYWNCLVSEQGNLYFATQPNPWDSKTTVVGKTNGSITTIYKTLSWHDSAEIDAISEWNGDIYVGGRIRTTGFTQKTGLLKFNGTNWDTIPGFHNIEVKGLRVVAGNLYVCGYKENFNTVVYEFKSNGTKTKIFDYWVSALYGFTSIKNNVYLVTNDFIRYNGTKWDSAKSNFVMANHNRIFFAAGDTSVFYLSNRNLYELKENNTVKRIDSIKLNHSIYKGAIMDNEVLFTGSDGSAIYSCYNLGSKSEYKINGLTMDIYGSNNKVYITKINFKSPKYLLNIRQLINGDAGVVSGRIYEDVDNSCAFVKSNDGIYSSRFGYYENLADTFLFFADDTGNYSVILPVHAKAYQAHILNSYTTTTAKICGDTPVISSTTNYQNDVPFSFQPNNRDVTIKVIGGTAWRARQGFEEYYDLQYSNTGTTTEDLEITLNFPDSVTFQKASVTPKSTAANTLTFEKLSVLKQSTRKIRVYFKVSVQKSLGSDLKFACSITPFSGDLNTMDNQDTLIQKVVAAIDPNIKTSNPEGKIYKPVSLIKYHINFQNLGTDTAYKVIVIDTFMPNFPLYKLQMTGQSHGYNLRVEPGNVLIWEFENIKLPPGTKDAINNQGYIAFEAPLSSPTKIGTVISNRAYIYFDYQKPVITDWCKIAHSEWGIGVVTPELNSKSLEIYPNPVAGTLNVKVPYKGCKVSIHSLIGTEIKSQIAGSEMIVMDVTDLPTGVYVVVAAERKVKLIKQ